MGDAMSDKRVKEIIIDCLDELYQNSEPPISWKEIQTKYIDSEKWFWNHEIEESKYEEIRAKYKSKLRPYQRSALDMALLNYAPKFKKE